MSTVFTSYLINIGVAYINLRWEFIQENKKVKKKHAFDQESDQEKRKRTITVKKKGRKHALEQRKVKKKDNDQEKRRKEMENAI